MANFNQSCDEDVLVSDSLIVANPALAVTDSVRTSASTLLRLFRRPLQYVTIELPPQFAYLKPGAVVWAKHVLLPDGRPYARESWELVPLYVVEVHDPIGVPKVTLRCLDMRDIYAAFWSPFRTEVGMTDDLNGIALLDRAGGWQTERDQVGYGVRPPGDDAWQEVLANRAIVDSFGLRLEAGADVNYLLNSTFSEGSGSTYTNWTNTTSGIATVNDWRLYTLIDANGFRRAAVLRTDNAGEAAYMSQTVAGMANRQLYIKAFYKDAGAYDRMGLRISRSDTGDYFRDSDGTWQVGIQTNPLTPGSGVIDTVRYVTKLIDTASGGAVSLTVSIGHFSAVSALPNISQLQGVELIEAIRRYHAFRSPLPTKAASVERVTSPRTWIVNDAGVRVCSPVRGFVKCTFVPLWSHEDLAGSDDKYLWAADFDGAVGLEFLRCWYEALDATNGRYVFANGDGFEVVLATGAGVGDLPVAGEPYTVICRWTSEDENEHGLNGQALDMWLVAPDGTVHTGIGLEGLTEQIADAETNVYLGSSLASASDMLDGHMRDLTIDDRCPTLAELLRI